jgi:hypothetical protein
VYRCELVVSVVAQARTGPDSGMVTYTQYIVNVFHKLHGSHIYASAITVVVVVVVVHGCTSMARIMGIRGSYYMGAVALLMCIPRVGLRCMLLRTGGCGL